MNEFIGKTCAFTVVGDLSIMIHSTAKPATAEWAKHADMVAGLSKTAGEKMKNLVFTDGGSPDRIQSALLNEAVNGQSFPTAVLMDNAVIRLVISVLAVWKWRIKAFAPTEFAAALQHLGVPTNQHAHVASAVRALSQRFMPTTVVTNALTALNRLESRA